MKQSSDVKSVDPHQNKGLVSPANKFTYFFWVYNSRRRSRFKKKTDIFKTTKFRLSVSESFFPERRVFLQKPHIRRQGPGHGGRGLAWANFSELEKKIRPGPWAFWGKTEVQQRAARPGCPDEFAPPQAPTGRAAWPGCQTMCSSQDYTTNN